MFLVSCHKTCHIVISRLNMHACAFASVQRGDVWGEGGQEGREGEGDCECAYVALYDSLFHIIIHKTLDNLVKRKCTIRQDHKSEDLRRLQCNLGIRDRMNAISRSFDQNLFTLQEVQ